MSKRGEQEAGLLFADERFLNRYLRCTKTDLRLTQQGMAATTKTEPAATKKAKAKRQPWPKSLSDQAAAVQAALTDLSAPADEADVARRFTRANKDRIAELLETLASLGKARQLDNGRYAAV
jgi:hypothetical protein